MNEMVNKFLLAGDKFMTEMQLGQPGSTYSACGPCTRNKERIQKFKERGDLRYIYQNELDKTCFRNDKDLPRRTASDKVLCHKAFYNDKNHKIWWISAWNSSMADKYFDKKYAIHKKMGFN